MIMAMGDSKRSLQSDQRLKNIKGEFLPATTTTEGQEQMSALAKIRPLTVYNYKFDEQKLIAKGKVELEKELKENFKNEKDKTKIAKARQEGLKNITRYAKETAKEDHVGFMAQDLQKVFPEEVVADEQGYLSLKRTYQEKVLFMMFQAIKELDRAVQGLITKVDELIEQYKEYNARLDAIEERLDKLERRKMFKDKTKDLN